MNIASIVGTRPQFLKLAALDSYVQKNNSFNHFIVHSGQHFDKNMSEVFFDQLDITPPHLLIERNQSSNIQNLSHIMIEFEKFILLHDINTVLVYGDCDTTLAGALVANKLNIGLVHIESGMRSYNKNMPEENNRVLTDHLSDFLFCPDATAVQNLKKELIKKNVFISGNLQIELSKNILEKNPLPQKFYNYALLTIHRHYNTNVDFLQKTFDSLAKLNQVFMFPVHPRTKHIIQENSIKVPSNIYMNDPFDYLEMLQMLLHCDYVITDSGGLQLESWYHKKRCIVMRSETEWIAPIESNNSILYNYKEDLSNFILNFLDKKVTDEYNLPLNTSELIIDALLNQ